MFLIYICLHYQNENYFSSTLLFSITRLQQKIAQYKLLHQNKMKKVSKKANIKVSRVLVHSLEFYKVDYKPPIPLKKIGSSTLREYLSDTESRKIKQLSINPIKQINNSDLFSFTDSKIYGSGRTENGKLVNLNSKEKCLDVILEEKDDI